MDINIGEKIKYFRKRAFMSQKILAEKLGVSNKVVSKWENNLCEPSLILFHKMSKILDFSMDEIFNENYGLEQNLKYIDIYDIDHKKTGEVATYEEIHEKGLWHREVAVWIENKSGEFLMQKRSDNKIILPGKWGLCAGHIYSGETDIEALSRIINKELNIEVNNYNFRYLITEKQKNDGVIYRYYKSAVIENYHDDYKNKNFKNYYILRIDMPINKVIPNKEEVSEVKWMKINEIVKLIKEGKTTFSNCDFAIDFLENLKIDLLDVVDENNNLTGKIEEKYEIHNIGLWHRESLIFVGNKKDGILCYKRVNNTKFNPGKIVPFFGGHVLTGESYEDAAVREIEEEIGLKVDKKSLVFLGQLKKTSHGKLNSLNRAFTNYYFVKSNKKIKDYSISPAEVDLVVWKNIDEVGELFFRSKEDIKKVEDSTLLEEMYNKLKKCLEE